MSGLPPQVECVPNVSEGRDRATIDAIANAAGAVPGATLLDVHTDVDHARSVLTLAGAPAAVSEAAFVVVREALARIDMNQHQGAHPRIGAADVVPFVPLRAADRALCVRLADELGARLAEELELPVYLYAHAARAPERRRLPWLRRPGYEGLGAALASEERAPDFGPARPHPTGGATVTGARDLLLAFNVDLHTEELRHARAIARAIRTSSGGLPGVQARGLRLVEQGRVQVSMNLLELGTTGPGRVLTEIRRLAAERGVSTGASELVGLIPRAALAEAAQAGLSVSGPPLATRTLEERLRGCPDPTAWPEYLDHLASPAHDAPGGGSALALCLALGTSCLHKALALSGGGRSTLDDAACAALLATLPPQAELLSLAEADHRAFATLMQAWKLERGPARKAALKAARPAASEVPARLLALAGHVATAALETAERGNQNLLNDAAAAVELALAAGRIARLNARANQRKAKRQSYADELAHLEACAQRVRELAG